MVSLCLEVAHASVLNMNIIVMQMAILDWEMLLLNLMRVLLLRVQFLLATMIAVSIDKDCALYMNG